MNPYLEGNQYPLPRPEELFAALNGGEKFTKLDLSEAYLQIELENESKQYLVINTHRRLYPMELPPLPPFSANNGANLAKSTWSCLLHRRHFGNREK